MRTGKKPVDVEASGHASSGQWTAAPPSRSRSLANGALANPRKVFLLVAALALGLVATLVGPLGTLQKAKAEDNNPTFYIGSNDGGAYVNFINSIRAQMNVGDSSVPRSTYQINHLNPSNTNLYLQVDLHLQTGGGYVRLQLNRRNLYVLGWWSYNNTYYYLGNRTVPAGERHRMQGGTWRDADRVQQIANENYAAMETQANESRRGMWFNHQTMNQAANWLFNNNVAARDRVRGALRMAQFVAEAARFRPIRDDIALAIGPNSGRTMVMPDGYIELQNNWGTLSRHLQALEAQPVGHVDPHPVAAWRRGAVGHAVRIILRTVQDYAHYVLLTSMLPRGK